MQVTIYSDSSPIKLQTNVNIAIKYCGEHGYRIHDIKFSCGKGDKGIVYGAMIIHEKMSEE